MRLIIIRHGDPDYEHDSLTEKGRREATLLAKRLSAVRLDGIYCSPLGRAKVTASYTLAAKGATAETCDWLREFLVVPRGEDPDDRALWHCLWDQLPQDWTKEPRFYQPEHWTEAPGLCEYNTAEEYVRVCRGLDGLLAEQGYERESGYYRAVRPNHGTVALFCHFGVECVMLAHLLGMTPMQLWHGTCALPTAVTELVTEERTEGIASWRMLSFGDVSHLTAGGEEPSFSARFCECFTDETRH